MVKEVIRTKSYYNKHAHKWASSHTDSFHHELPFIKLQKLISKGDSVVDIGCASGIHLPLFLGIGKGLKYTGLDISKSLLKIAKQRYPQVNFIEGDISKKKSLPKKKFDAFFAAAVLMHIPFTEWDIVFSNIERISKSGAYGYLTLPVEHTNTDVTEDTRHFTILTKQEQEKYIKSRNWKIIDKGTPDGHTRSGIWKRYIVKLP